MLNDVPPFMSVLFVAKSSFLICGSVVKILDFNLANPCGFRGDKN